MEQRVNVKEKLIVHILDEDGNVVDTREFKPPSTPLEKIASRLGILKRHNTVNNSGLNAAAKRWVGVTQDPVTWIAVRLSSSTPYPTAVGTWQFHSADVSVTGDKAYVRNPNYTWGGGPTSVYDTIGTATNNSTNAIVSYIDGVDIVLKSLGDSLWAEIEFDFDAS